MDFYITRRLWIQEKRVAAKRLRQNLKQIRRTSKPMDLPSSVFHRYFRLEKSSVLTLISELESKSTFKSIPFQTQVLATCHFYGQGSYQASIGSNHILGLSQPSVSRCVTNVTKLILKYLQPKHLKFPATILEKTKSKTRFQQKYGLSNIVAAVDGVHIALIAPPENSVETPGNLYLCRKGFHSLNVLVCCNADMKILYANASFPGSVHDSAVWKTSKLRSHFLNRYSSVQTQSEFIIADSGFPLEPWILVPYSKPLLDSEKKFNKKLISARNCIERCFGIVKTRFRCLFRHRVLHYSPKKAAQIIYAVFTLHNMFLNDTAIDLDEEDEENEENQQPEEEIETEVNNIYCHWRNLGCQVRNRYAEHLL